MVSLIQDLGRRVGEEVTLKGWLSNLRSSGSLAFLEIRDGSGFVQAVAAKAELPEETWKKIEGLTQESSVVVTGLVKKHPKQEGVYELQVKHLEVIQVAEE